MAQGGLGRVALLGRKQHHAGGAVRQKPAIQAGNCARRNPDLDRVLVEPARKALRPQGRRPDGQPWIIAQESASADHHGVTLSAQAVDALAVTD